MKLFLPAVLYSSETWSLILRDKYVSSVLSIKVLMGICRGKKVSNAKMDKNVKFLLFRKIESNKTKENKIGRWCGMDGRSDKCLQNFSCIADREGAAWRHSNHVFCRLSIKALPC